MRSAYRYGLRSLTITTSLLFFTELGDASLFCAASEVVADGAPVAKPASRFASRDPRHGTHQASVQGLVGATGGHMELFPAEVDPSAMPDQIHIALAASESPEEYAMTIAWATWPDTKSTVAWGMSADELVNVAEGTSTTYSANHPGRADYTSGFLHSATITNLLPSKTYYYACGDETRAMSTVRSFITPAKIGADQPVTLGILGDLGQTSYSEGTLAVIDADKSLDLVLHAGDLSYADCDQPRWDSFMRMLDPVASRLPWMVAAGNHEIEAGATGGSPFVAYEHRFRMPAAKPPVRANECGRGGGLEGDVEDTASWQVGRGADDAQAAATEVSMRMEAEILAGTSTDESSEPAVPGRVERAVVEAALRVRRMYGSQGITGPNGERMVGCCPSEWSGTYDFGNSFYSFDVASVHVLVLNPYTATGEESIQYQWAKEDLESTDRSRTPWVIVMMHCPWYNSNLAHQGERQALTAMRAFEPLFNTHKVALVVAGHVHAYERSYPVTNYQLTDDGPVYLVVGGSGNREGHASAFYPQPLWSAFRNGDIFGSGRLSVRDSTKALWEWMSSEEGRSVHDAVWIENPYLLSEASAAGDDAEDSPELAALAGGGTTGGPAGSANGDEDDTPGQGATSVGSRLRIPGLASRSPRMSR